MNKEVKFEVLKGKTLVKVEGLEAGSKVVTFECSDGTKYEMHHYQDCCEQVAIEEIHGYPEDMVGLVVEAEEETNADGPAPEHADSYTWTFYKLGTTKGSITIRWLGESNGYYSESVDFRQIK